MIDNTTFPYDVFISYRWVTPDQEWVREQLYPALANAGLKVCLDVEDFVPGRDLILEMERAGQQSRHVLCIISPEYFEEGRLSEFESLSARRHDPGGRNSFLIPLIFRETDIPERIRGLISIVWTNPKDHLREWKKLLRVLGATNLNAPLPSDGPKVTNDAKKRLGPPRLKEVIGGIVGSGAFALFIGLVVSALQVAGVISLFMANILIVAAWAVFVIAICVSRRFRSVFPKHTNAAGLAAILLIGIVLLVFDRWMVKKRAEQEGQVALSSTPNTSTSSPVISPSPKSSASIQPPSGASTPSEIPTQPAPTLAPSPGAPSQTVASEFNQRVLLERGSSHNILDILKENGYSGPMFLRRIMICNSPYNKDEVSVERLSGDKNVNETLAPGKCYNDRAEAETSGIDASQISVSSNSTAKIIINAQP
jgi:hypothetical protein